MLYICIQSQTRKKSALSSAEAIEHDRNQLCAEKDRVPSGNTAYQPDTNEMFLAASVFVVEGFTVSEASEGICSDGER